MDDPDKLLELLKLAIEKWFSWPGFLITFVILISLVRPLREKIFSSRWKIPTATGPLEHIPPDPGVKLDESSTSSGKVVRELTEGKTEPPRDQVPAELVKKENKESESPETKVRKITMRMHFASFKKDIDEVEAAYGELESIPEESIDRESIDSLYYYSKAVCGDTGAVPVLQKLEKDNPTWTSPSSWLANYYSSLHSYDKALQHLDIGLERSGEDFWINSALIRQRATIFSKIDQNRKALKILYDLSDETTDPSSKSFIYDNIADIYESLEDTTKFQLVLEQALIWQPENNDRRFRLAYSYGEDDDTKALAIYHYSILTANDPNFGFAMNNFAVALGKFDLLVSKVRSLKQANAEGQGYPAGNLAIDLASQGFLEEAQQVLESLSPEQRVQTRAIAAAEFIEKKRRDDDKKRKNLMGYAEGIHKFQVEAATARSVESIRIISPPQMIGSWNIGTGQKFVLSNVEGKKFGGEMETENVKYKISGEMDSVKLELKFVEHKIRMPVSGLFGLGMGLGQNSGTREWTDRRPSLLDIRTDFTLNLVIVEPNKMIGYREDRKGTLSISEVTVTKEG